MTTTATAITPNLAHQYLLEGFLAYLKDLYCEDEISEEVYEVLASRAIALSSEAIATNTVQGHLHKYENYLANLTSANE